MVKKIVNCGAYVEGALPAVSGERAETRLFRERSVKMMEWVSLTKRLLSLALVLGVFLFSFSARAAQAEKRLKIEVQANYIKMPEHVQRVRIARVLIRNTELRELIKGLGATHIEKVYQPVQLQDGSTGEEEVADTYVLVFPENTGLAAELQSFTDIDVVQSAIIEQ